MIITLHKCRVMETEILAWKQTVLQK